MQVLRVRIDKIPALYYTPIGVAPADTRPAVIFLHGVSETGDGTEQGLDKLQRSGNHASLLKAGDQFGFNVVAPQFVPALNEWVPEWTGGAYVDKVIEWVKATLPVDANRIYLSGISGGGGGTWNYITKELAYANKVAAAVPICGLEQVKGDFSIPAKSGLPIWAFHATDDKTVSVGSSRRQIECINKFNPLPLAKFTEYPTGGHAIWGRVFGDPALYSWMLGQSRNATQAPKPRTVQRIAFADKRVLLSDGLYYDCKSIDFAVAEKAIQVQTTPEAGDEKFSVPL